jgi:hypothetical protein
MSDSKIACQSIPLVAFHKRPIDSKIRIVGQARLRADFHPEGGFGVDSECKLIGIRIMPSGYKPLNLVN